MVDESKPVMAVPKEKAVFRLDKNGIWYNGNEKFTNKKIIHYFHSMIKKDKDGYFLGQEHKDYIEKVYFPYEDTPLFVFRIIKTDQGLVLRLNTGEDIKLNPEKLFVRDDHLYLQNDDDLIKFSEHAMLTLAEYMDDEDNQYTIIVKGERYPIPMVE
ncbi:MAG: DUF1285 domain-containing protein [Deltaproteobacteria bacterium]|nr:DUF1285 domain-containing protein [Deltaproteobacteria bacterium]